MYVLLAHIIYVMESGRFSQSPTFLKRAGHNLRKPLFIPLGQFYCTLYFLSRSFKHLQNCQKTIKLKAHGFKMT